MKKMITASMCLVLVFVFHSTTFADSGKSAGEILKELDLVKGDDNGDLMESQTLKRQDAILLLLRMLGEDEEARKYTGKSSFTDLKEGSYYYNSVAYAEHKNLTKGMSKTSFGVDSFLTEKQMLTFILRTLDYNDVAWDDIVEKAEEVGITDGLIVQANADALRAKVFDYMLAGLNTKLKGTNQELGAKLGLKGYDVETKPSDEVYTGDFKVAEVNADSLKTIEIVFTDKIDPFYVNKLHIKFKKNSYDLYLNEDGKTVSVVFRKSIKEKQKINLSIKDVKSLNGDVIEEYEEEIVMKDDVAPRLLEAKFLDKRTLMLKFSEPVNVNLPYYASYQSISVDGKNPHIKTVKNDSETELFLIFKADLKDGEHDVLLKYIADYANNKLSNQDLDLVVDKDVGAPEVLKVDFVNNKRLRAYFNEPIYNKGVFRIASTNAKAARFYNNRHDIVEIDFEKNIGLGAVLGENLEYRYQADANNNKVDDWDSFYFEEADDTSLPEVKIADSVDNKKVLEFTKSMDSNYGKVELLSKDGKRVLATLNAPFTFEPNTSDSVLRVDFSSNIQSSDSNTFRVRVSDFRDLTFRENEIQTVEEEIKGADFEDPELVYRSGKQGALLTKGANGPENDTISFTFSEAMNLDDLNNLANYKSSDSAFGQFNSIDGAYVEGVYDNDKRVVIVVPNARNIKKSSSFTVFAIRDKSGRMMDTTTGVKLISSSRFVLNSAVADKKDEILLTFSIDVAEFDADAYAVKKSDDEVLFINNYEIDKDDARKVTVFLDDEMTSSPADYVLQPISDENGIRSKFDEEMSSIVRRNIVDELGPYVEKIESKDYKFTVTMSEPVLFDSSAQSVSENLRAYDQDGNLLVKGTDFDVQRVGSNTSTYVSEFEVIGLNPNNEDTFREGLTYKIELLAAWSSSGAQSKVYEESVELRGDVD